jgi:hypothetical protein
MKTGGAWCLVLDGEGGVAPVALESWLSMLHGTGYREQGSDERE